MTFGFFSNFFFLNFIQYLAMLHAIFGRSADAVSTIDGQSLIHLLADKGDPSAEMLQTLLQLKVQSKSGPKPLFDVSILNKNQETPLDVAKAKSSQLRGEQIQFQKVISILSQCDENDSDLTFVNVFDE
jgi:hypothetical protein